MYVGPWQEFVLAKRLYSNSKREVVVNPSYEPNNEVTVSQQGPYGDLHKQQRRMWKNEKSVESHSSTIPNKTNIRRRHISVVTEKNVDGDDGSNSYCNDNRVQTIGSLGGDQRESMLSGDGRTEKMLLSRQTDCKNAAAFTVATPPTQRWRQPNSLLEEVQERKRVIMGGKEQSKRASTMSQEEAINPPEADYKNQNSCDELQSAEKMKTTADIPHMELTDDTCSLVAKYFAHSSSAAFNTVSTTTLAEPTTAVNQEEDEKPPRFEEESIDDLMRWAARLSVPER